MISLPLREHMPHITHDKNAIFHALFKIGILLKGVFAILEILAGGFILLVNRAAVSDALLYLVHGELVEDPQSFFANYIADLSHNLSASTELFVGGYFLLYGLVKLLLVVGLLRGNILSYRAAIVCLSLFVAYMLYRFSYTHSPFLALLIATDAVIVALIWREYRFIQNKIRYN